MKQQSNSRTISNHEHRARSLAHDTFGHGPDERVLDASAPVRRHHDEVAVVLSREPNDFGDRRSRGRRCRDPSGAELLGFSLPFLQRSADVIGHLFSYNFIIIIAPNRLVKIKG